MIVLYLNDLGKMGEREGFLPYPEEFETICIHHTKELTMRIQKERSQFITPIVMSNLVKGGKIGSKQVLEIDSLNVMKN